MGASLDLHNGVEACGSRGGRTTGEREHSGAGVRRALQDGSPAVWLRAAAGERGGPQGPVSEITHEGEEKTRLLKCRGCLFPEASDCGSRLNVP